jgi:hypothetical protein
VGLISIFHPFLAYQMSRYGDAALTGAAVDAVIRVLDKDSESDRQKLTKANVLGVALNFHKTCSNPSMSLKWLISIIGILNHLVILDEGSFKELLCLFE